DDRVVRVCRVWVYGLAPRDDRLHPEAVEETAHAFADRNRDDGRGAPFGGTRGRDVGARQRLCRLVTNPLLLFDLVEEVRDANTPGSPSFDARLDRSADLVRVHVAVPHAVATDDDDRVAERGPRLLERGDRPFLGFEGVHDLVPER